MAAVNVVFVSSSNELGAFESGTAGELFGPVPAVVGGGVGTLLVVLFVAWQWPRLRRLGPLRELQPAAVTGGETVIATEGGMAAPHGAADLPPAAKLDRG